MEQDLLNKLHKAKYKKYFYSQNKSIELLD